MSDLELSLLGPVRVTLAGQPIKFRTRKAQALLLYLASEAWQRPDIAPRRETLLALLWPDYPEESARHSLRTDLYYLKQAIPGVAAKDGGDPAPLVLSDNQSVQINPVVSYELDLAKFSRHLDFSANHNHFDLLTCAECEDRLRKAVELYRGDFLADFYLEDSNPFEAWTAAKREALRREMLEALDSLTAIHLNQGMHWEAQHYTRRQLEIDELRERAHRQLMRALVLDGQRNEALAQYEKCRQLLEEGLGLEPEEETTRLYEQIRSGTLEFPEPAPDGPGVSPTLPEFLTEDKAGEPEQPAAFVARERELAQLAAALDSARGGQGQILFIIGGAGRGKTTLVQEFARRAQANDIDLIVVNGYCNAITGIGDPYLPFREALVMLTGDVEARWAGGLISRRHARQLWELMPVTLPALVKHGPDLVGSLVPVQDLRERATTLSAQDSDWFKQLAALTAGEHRAGLDQKQIFAEYTAVIKAIAAERPILLIIEDLHWVDAASSGLLFHLSREIGDSQVLLVGTYRPEELALKRPSPAAGAEEQHLMAGIVSELKRQHGDIWLDLGDPAIAEGRHFVDTYLDTQPNRLDETFREALFRRTQGHALFTVELLRAMYERGDLWQDEEGQWIEREAIDWTTLPVKVEGAIEKRIERLSEASQAILTIASIEGETFTAEIVAHVQGLDERTLVQQLSRELDKQHRLVTAEAIRWLDPGRQRVSIYRFRHQLFQHYLYHRLDEVERGYLHESVGTVLEQLYAGRTKEVAGQLAWHFEQACLASKAIHYLQEAGQAAADAYANTEAIAHYSRAIELAENDGIGAVELAHLYIRLGGLLLITKGDAALEVRRAFGRAFELYQQAGESPQLFTALKGLAMYHKLRGESETARRLTDQIMVLANSLQDPMFMVEACFAMGSLFYYAGEFAPAQEYLERGINSYDLEQYRSLTMLYDQDPGVASLSYASMNLWMLGYPGRALVQCSESLALAEELSHPYSLVMALIWNGWVHLFRREGRLVEERTEAAISLSEEYDFALFSAVGMLLRGWALTMRGEVEEGIMQMKQGLSMSAVTIQNQGGEYLPPQLICPLADAHGDVGQPEEGLQAIVKAQTQMNKDRGWLFVEAEIYRLKGKLLLLRDGSENEIEANFQQAIDISRQQEAKSLELRGATSLARLWVSQGKQEEARQLLAPVYGWFSQGFDTLDLIEAKALLDELS